MIEDECEPQGQLFIVFAGLVLSVVCMIYYERLTREEEKQPNQVKDGFSFH